MAEVAAQQAAAAAPPPEAPVDGSAPDAGAPDDAELVKRALGGGDADGATTEQPAEGAEAAAGEQPGAKTEPEKPEDERDTALFRRALRERERVVSERHKVEELHQQVRQERAALARDRAEIDAWRAKKAKIDADPYAFFDEFGVDPNDFARRMMDANDPVTRQLAEERKKREELEQRLEKQDEERATRERQVVYSRAKESFVSFVDQQHEKFPDIADEDPAEVAEVFWELASQHHANTGQIPTFEMVAHHMQRAAESKRATRDQRRQQRTKASAPAANPGGGNTAPQRTAPTGHVAKGPGPRAPSTLTNADATTRSTEPRQLTREELDELDAAELRRAFRMDADS